VTVTYHDLSAIERDTLLGTATADATVGDRPHKGDVFDAVNDIAEWSVSRPTVYSAIDRLDEANLLRVRPINDRAQGVTLTPTGVHLLHDAGGRLKDAAGGDYNEVTAHE
jgi:Fe2+ or Zn2+ uptake regulation protein